MKPIIVRMNEVGISTKEQPIIGTEALGPCIGGLIYSKKHKKSVVFHASSDWKQLILEVLIVLAENGLISPENFSKSVEIFELYEKYDLYNFDNKTKKAILTKKGLNISKKETEESLQITIIPGYYQDHYNVATNIKKFFSSLEPMIALRHNELPKKAIRTRMFDDLGSHEFYFDSLEEKFVTEKIKNNIDSKEYRL